MQQVGGLLITTISLLNMSDYVFVLKNYSFVFATGTFTFQGVSFLRLKRILLLDIFSPFLTNLEDFFVNLIVWRWKLGTTFIH